jgi:predicted DNA-binding protein (UPF0278 family)
VNYFFRGLPLKILHGCADDQRELGIRILSDEEFKKMITGYSKLISKGTDP